MAKRQLAAIYVLMAILLGMHPASDEVTAEYSAPGHVDAAVIGTIASFIANGGAMTPGAPSAPQAASN